MDKISLTEKGRRTGLTFAVAAIIGLLPLVGAGMTLLKGVHVATKAKQPLTVIAIYAATGLLWLLTFGMVLYPEATQATFQKWYWELWWVHPVIRDPLFAFSEYFPVTLYAAASLLMAYAHVRLVRTYRLNVGFISDLFGNNRARLAD